MVKEGLTSRWKKTYEPAEYDCLVAFSAFVADDVPQPLRIFDVDHEMLALLFEASLEKRFNDDAHTFSPLLDNTDRGGGGRRSKTQYAGYLLYVAVKFADKE